MSADGTTAYLWHGGLYTLEDAPAELLAHLRERGQIPETAVSEPVETPPDPEHVGAPTPEQADFPAADVAEAAGVGYLAEALREAGFDWASHIVQASEAELTAVSGIGKATAAKLWSAAWHLLGETPE